MMQIDVASNSALLAVVEKISEQNDILKGNKYILTDTDKAEIADLVVETSIAEIEAKKDSSLSDIETAKTEMLTEIERVADIVQTTGASETAVMSQKAVTNIANTLATVFIANSGKLYVERTSGYTYIKCTASVVIANRALGKVGYSWDTIISNIPSAYVATSPSGVTQCIKAGDGGDALVFNVSTKRFTLKQVSVVDSNTEIVLFFNNYYEFGGCLYSKAEEVANTLAPVFLNPNASFYSEYYSNNQYIKIEGSAPTLYIRNLHLGSLSFNWSDIIGDTSVSPYVATSPDGKTDCVKITTGRALVYNVLTHTFSVPEITSIDTTIQIVLFYHYYTVYGGVLYEQYVDRLNNAARLEIDEIAKSIEKTSINSAEFIELSQLKAPSTSVVSQNSAGITEVTFNGTGSNKTHITEFVTCRPLSVVVVEFYGKSSEPQYDNTYVSTGGYIELRFYDADGASIGSQSSAWVVGEQRCGYHRFGWVVPIGAVKALVGVTTRGNTSITIHDFNLHQEKCYPARNRQSVLYDAHLGAIASAPENTLPAFELAKIAGFRACISNCNWTADDVLVCLHDDTLASHSNGTGNVHDYTFEQLQAFDFSTKFNGTTYTGTKIPKLEWFVQLMASSGIRPIFRLHTDWRAGYSEKTTQFLTQIYSWICKYGLKGNATVKGFDIGNLDAAYAIMGNDVEYILDCESISTNALSYVERYRNNGSDLTLELPFGSLLSMDLSAALAQKINLSAYTVNNTAAMRELMLKGVTRFCTDTFSDIVFPID